MLNKETNELFLIFFSVAPRAFALDVEAALAECSLKVDVSIVARGRTCTNHLGDSLSGNYFVRTNCTKQQLIFPIPNVLCSLNIQIMANFAAFNSVTLLYSLVSKFNHVPPAFCP